MHEIFSGLNNVVYARRYQYSAPYTRLVFGDECIIEDFGSRVLIKVAERAIRRAKAWFQAGIANPANKLL
jgi:hypothetical protein